MKLAQIYEVTSGLRQNVCFELNLHERVVAPWSEDNVGLIILRETLKFTDLKIILRMLISSKQNLNNVV